MSARPSASSAAKANAENRMMKKHEKEHEHQMECDDQVEYYKSCDRTNKQLEEWTSSRYYDTNNQMIEDLKKKRQQKEQDLEEENRPYEFPQAPKAGIPTEVLQDVHLGDERKRHQTEEKLQENREMALENLKQHKMKLKQKSASVQVDHENSVKLVEAFDRDIRKNRKDKQHQKEEWKKEVDAQLEDNRVRKEDEKIREQRQIDRELESPRSRIFY